MNKYVFVLIVCAVVFLVCFLIDSLLKLLFPKSRLEKSKQVVRPPRRSAVIGVILTFAGAAMLVKLLPEKGDLLFILGSIVAVIFGVILLCTYFSFVIYYDDEGFLYKAWGHGKQEFRYSQIRGQRSLLTRGGVNTILFVGDDWYGTDKWREYEKEFAKAGVRIIYFPYTRGVSSTQVSKALAAVRGETEGAK